MILSRTSAFDRISRLGHANMVFSSCGLYPTTHGVRERDATTRFLQNPDTPHFILKLIHDPWIFSYFSDSVALSLLGLSHPLYSQEALYMHLQLPLNPRLVLHVVFLTLATYIKSIIIHQLAQWTCQRVTRRSFGWRHILWRYSGSCALEDKAA